MSLSTGALMMLPSALRCEDLTYGTDAQGKPVHSLAGGSKTTVAAVFVATDCPISNRYLPLLARMAREFEPQGVRLWLVYPNPQDTLAVVQDHQLRYPAAGELSQLLNPSSQFLFHSHVHVTPEAAIFRSDDPIRWPVLWHGRIDNRYLSFGTQRPAATQHDFADAIRAVLAGRLPVEPATPPVGCAIVPRI